MVADMFILPHVLGHAQLAARSLANRFLPAFLEHPVAIVCDTTTAAVAFKPSGAAT